MCAGYLPPNWPAHGSPAGCNGGNASEVFSAWKGELLDEPGWLPSVTLRFATRAEGSCEKGHPSPARQLPMTQYLFHPHVVSHVPPEDTRRHLLAEMIRQIVTKPAICPETLARR